MFHISQYFFTPKDAYRLARGMKLRDWLGAGALASLGHFLAVFAGLDAQAIFFLLFAGALFWFKWDARISIGFALACLVAIPFLTIFSDELIFITQKEWAERAAVWAFYFLVIGVVKQLYEYWK